MASSTNDGQRAAHERERQPHRQAARLGLAEAAPGGAGVDRQPVEHRSERQSVAIGAGDRGREVASGRSELAVSSSSASAKRPAPVQLQLDGDEGAADRRRGPRRQLGDRLVRRAPGVDAQHEQLDGVGHRLLDRAPHALLAAAPVADGDGGNGSGSQARVGAGRP